MRLAPIAMFFARDPARAIQMAADCSRTTHGAAAAVDVCRYFAALIVGALCGAGRHELVSDHYCPIALKSRLLSIVPFGLTLC